MIEEVSELVGLKYREIHDSKDVVQLVNDFLFPWDEKMESAKYPMAIDEDEMYFEKVPDLPYSLNNYSNFAFFFDTFKNFVKI